MSEARRERVLGLFDPAGLAMAGVVAVALLAVFFRWFQTQTRFSVDALDDWGHAFVVPWISAYVVWLRRDAIARAQVREFWPGLAPMLLGIMCYLFFLVGAMSNHMFQGFALVLTLFGVSLLLAGPEVMRHLFLPIVFLLLGITVSEAIMLRLTFPLQILAASGASGLLSVAGLIGGFEVEQSGNILNIVTSSGTVHPLNVAEACSGMRMVVSFVALGAAVAVLGCSVWWQRVWVMLVTVPVALAINVVRVSVLGLLTLVDPDLATGNAHMFIGTLLLVPGLFVFLGIVWILKRVVREPRPGAA